MSSKKRIEELMNSNQEHDVRDNGFPGEGLVEVIKVQRTKPGEGLLRQLALREIHLMEQMGRLKAQREFARDKVTGKNKARVYVAKWLAALTREELSKEAEEQGIDGGVASREDVLKCMFGEYKVPIFASGDHESEMRDYLQRDPGE